MTPSVSLSVSKSNKNKNVTVSPKPQPLDEKDWQESGGRRENHFFILNLILKEVKLIR